MSTQQQAPIVFNVNHYVRVRLTERGREIMKPFPLTTPKEDGSGWSRWQFWRLMETFGPHLHMGCTVPFETNIQIEITARQDGSEGA